MQWQVLINNFITKMTYLQTELPCDLCVDNTWRFRVLNKTNIFLIRPGQQKYTSGPKNKLQIYVY